MLKIHSLHIYPVKACQGIEVSELEVSPMGVKWDRKWAVYSTKKQKVLNQIMLPVLASIETHLEKDALILTNAQKESFQMLFSNPGTPAIIDRGPALDEGDLAAEFLCSSMQQEGLRLLRKPDELNEKSFVYDCPLHIASLASLEKLNQHLETPVPMDRFRANIILDGLEPFEEDTLEEIKLNGIVLKKDSRTARCIYTTQDQTTGNKQGKEPLKALLKVNAENGKPLFGSYFIPATRGKVSVYKFSAGKLDRKLKAGS